MGGGRGCRPAPGSSAPTSICSAVGSSAGGAPRYMRRTCNPKLSVCPLSDSSGSSPQHDGTHVVSRVRSISITMATRPPAPTYTSSNTFCSEISRRLGSAAAGGTNSVFHSSGELPGTDGMLTTARARAFLERMPPLTESTRRVSPTTPSSGMPLGLASSRVAAVSCAGAMTSGVPSASESVLDASAASPEPTSLGLFTVDRRGLPGKGLSPPSAKSCRYRPGLSTDG